MEYPSTRAVSSSLWDDERPVTRERVTGRRGDAGLPGVGDVDDQPLLAGGGAVEDECAERQVRPHAQSEDRDALERAARCHLAEGAEPADVRDVVRVGEAQRLPVRPQRDLQVA